MREKYDIKGVEDKWRKRWEKEELFAVKKGTLERKMYVLDMFPYPSGDGLHVGHVKIYSASDAVARYLRMKGFNVLHPAGWDAFGLPTENSAIKFKVHPEDLTKKNIDHFREQMKMMGFSYDWSREINTTDPKYYKWTQWIFLQLLKMGLAYEDTVPINWCPSCKTGLANEEVVDGKCERCGAAVEQKPMRQWMLRITKYADRLLQGLDGLEWPDFIIDIQKNWIGRSKGTEIDFRVIGLDEPVKVFTTRPDTIFGATYLVLSPEHPSVAALLGSKDTNLNIANNDEVKKYVDEARHKADEQRMADDKGKSGVEIRGVKAVNPMNGEVMPVWVADYVLMGYGTGAIMAVPAHDERDFVFAKKHGLQITQVIQPVLAGEASELPFTGDGVVINSGDYSGVEAAKVRDMITESLQLKGAARKKINYKLRDWIFSRQHYWGEPIPVIHCESCGVVPVPENELPVELPKVERYEPTDTGESPLAAIKDWVNVKCPTCSLMGKRETDTMPNWAGSSWYWLRYLDPSNDQELVSREEVDKWLPVDVYIGGAEHAVLHLLYARFWSHVLADIGVVERAEPFKRFRSVGLLLGEDGQKMSKSKGNVINPDDVVKRAGADALRIYVMFMGPFGNVMPWSEASLNGAGRFLKRVWAVVTRLMEKTSTAAKESGDKSGDFDLLIQQTIKRVSEGTEQFKFNTAIAALMELLNELEKQAEATRLTLETYVLLLAPYAPHMAEELWEKLGHAESLVSVAWPEFDQRLLSEADVMIPVQVNGKVRGELSVASGAGQEQVEMAARELDNVKKYLKDKSLVKVIYVANRLVNFVTAPETKS